MPATATRAAEPPEQRLDLRRVGWDQYVRVSEALGERHNPRMIYLDGSLTFLVTSRRHDWYAELLGQLVIVVANCCDIAWETAGQATYRREDLDAGVEGDKTFYFGEHAEQMSGPVDIDLSTQPPPDLAIEVEVTHSADVAVSTWGRLGVPEVWRFDAVSGSATFWNRRDDGTYAQVGASRHIPGLTPADVLGQMRSAEELGAPRWFRGLDEWARATILPRLADGA